MNAQNLLVREWWFEGDIIEWRVKDDCDTAVLKYNKEKGYFWLESLSTPEYNDFLFNIKLEQYKHVGNIHEVNNDNKTANT